MGVVGVIARVVVVAFPFDSIVTLALVLGIWLIVLGVIEVVSCFSVRSDVKNVENFGVVGARSHAVVH